MAVTALSCIKIAQLKSALKALGMVQTGSKAVLVARLASSKDAKVKCLQSPAKKTVQGKTANKTYMSKLNTKAKPKAKAKGKKIAAPKSKAKANKAITKVPSKGAGVPIRGASRRTLSVSNYLRIYKATPPDPEHSQIEEGLAKCSSVAVGKFRLYQASRGLVGAVRKVWTDSDCYKELNQAIINDDERALLNWMPLVRKLNASIVRNPTAMERSVYRGSCSLEAASLAMYVPNAALRLGMYVATSERLEVAQKFQQHGWLLAFRVPHKCYNAGDISNDSAFQEYEVLLPPYTAVRVTAKNALIKRIDLLVLDNLDESLSLPVVLA